MVANNQELIAPLESGDEERLVSTEAPMYSSVERVSRTALVGLVLVVGAVVALLVALPASHGQAVMQKDSEESIEVLDTQPNEVESGQFNWQIVHTERDLCSTPKENCASTMCCKTSGYRCYGMNDTFATCMETCDPSTGKLCKPLSKTLRLASDYMKPARSLFCFAVFTQDTGSTKKSYEKELLTAQYEKKASIFSCEEYAVYSDVEVTLGNGLQARKVTDVNNEFHFAKRKITGTWVNTGMFIQVWKAIAAAGSWKNYDWVVKVDPDAVFVPERLRNRIQWMPRTLSGSILQNCKHVDYGFFGNLEVISNMAFSVLLANMDKCRTTLPWKIGVKNGKYGPMGEDLFAEICMEKNGVDKVEAFDLTKDAACPANRPDDRKKDRKWRPDCNTDAPAMHPFKKPDEYFACLDKTLAFV